MEKNLVVMPKSKFLRVMCKKCKTDQVIYNKPATLVKCTNCGEELAIPTGGEAFIKGKVLEVLS
ncbi:MAG: 30S ribosomal protein S27e [Candidatus Aenigmatarchaeota archaeon]